jgi:hypothetical protein
MLKQLVLLESQRLVPKSMCEAYRKRAANGQSLRVDASLISVTPQQHIAL